MTTTTADTASLADVKVELKSLISQREDLERRIAEASARLHAPGQPGLKETLIDKEVSLLLTHSCKTCELRQFYVHYISARVCVESLRDWLR